MGTELLEQAVASTRKVLQNLTKDDLDKATPCTNWKVRDILNHIIGGTHFFVTTKETGVGPDDGGEGQEFTDGDVVAAFDNGTKQAIAAFNAPGALEKIVKLPFGEMPGAAVMSIETSDIFQHG